MSLLDSYGFSREDFTETFKEMQFIIEKDSLLCDQFEKIDSKVKVSFVSFQFIFFAFLIFIFTFYSYFHFYFHLYFHFYFYFYFHYFFFFQASFTRSYNSTSHSSQVPGLQYPYLLHVHSSHFLYLFHYE